VLDGDETSCTHPDAVARHGAERAASSHGRSRLVGTTRTRWLLGTTAAALLVVLWWLARGIDRTALDGNAIAAHVHDAGAAAPIALFALLIVQCVVSPLPSEPLMMAAGFLYGPWAGFVLAWSGVVLGATVCFLIARRLGRPVAERLVARDKLAAFDQAFAGKGVAATFLAVLAVRIFAHGSFDVVSYACGLVAMPLPLFLIASGVGVVPKVLAFTYLGASRGTHPRWLDVLIVAGMLGMLLLVPIWWRTRSLRAPDLDG